MKIMSFVILGALMSFAPLSFAGKFKKCDKQERQCLKNPLRKASGDCKKAKRRCEKDMKKKMAKRTEKANRPLPVERVEGDLLANSAFEDMKGSSPASWQMVGSKKNWQAHGGRKHARTGSTAIQLKNGSGKFSQLVPLPGEGKSRGFYKLRYWVRGEGVGAGSKVSVLSEAMSRSKSTSDRLGEHRALKNEWTMHEKTIAIKGDEFAARVSFSWNIDRNDAKKNGTIWIDDVSLVKE
ncbi:MAG: hypothetical protein HRT45_04200 [Bdellovibrionales bacterium]|nr:hypothetical protein [Bdellovibrionales bacterium]